MEKSLHHTTITMINNRKMMVVFVTILTLTVGLILATTGVASVSQVSAQNITTGDNMTGGETGNMTAETNRTGSISSAGEGEPIPDIDVKLGKGKPR